MNEVRLSNTGGSITQSGNVTVHRAGKNYTGSGVISTEFDNEMDELMNDVAEMTGKPVVKQNAKKEYSMHVEQVGNEKVGFIKAKPVKAPVAPKVVKPKVVKPAQIVHPDGTVFFREDRKMFIAMWNGKQEAARPTVEGCLGFLKRKYNFDGVVLK
jgi:hypothetical protein